MVLYIQTCICTYKHTLCTYRHTLNCLLSTAVSLPNRDPGKAKLIHQISAGQNVSITFVVQATPNITTYTPIWHLQSYEHERAFVFESPNRSLEREKTTMTHFTEMGVEASASIIRQNASHVDCTLTLSRLGAELGHLVVLFSVQTQCGCKVHAPAAALVEVMSSQPRPPLTPVITPPPSTPTTTESNHQMQISNTETNGKKGRVYA